LTQMGPRYVAMMSSVVREATKQLYNDIERLNYQPVIVTRSTNA
jgi:hypothetical protein